MYNFMVLICLTLLHVLFIYRLKLFWIYKNKRLSIYYVNDLPPQHSKLKRFANLCETKGEIFNRSCVRTLVANNDWWASRNVVSVNKSLSSRRTAFAKPSGPEFSKMSRKPVGLCTLDRPFLYCCLNERENSVISVNEVFYTK